MEGNGVIEITFGGCYGMILFRSPIHVEDSGNPNSEVAVQGRPTSRLFDKTRKYVLSPHGVTWHHDLSLHLRFRTMATVKY